MYKINTRDFGWNVIDNNLYLCNDDLDRYYQMNETAHEIWNIILSHSSCNDEIIVDILLEKYNCDKEQLQQDVKKFITQLVTVGAIVQVEA